MLLNRSHIATNLGLMESMMVLRPRQGNIRQVFIVFKSHANNLNLRFHCRGLNTIIDYISHTLSFPFLRQENEVAIFLSVQEYKNTIYIKNCLKENGTFIFIYLIIHLGT